MSPWATAAAWAELRPCESGSRAPGFTGAAGSCSFSGGLWAMIRRKIPRWASQWASTRAYGGYPAGIRQVSLRSSYSDQFGGCPSASRICGGGRVISVTDGCAVRFLTGWLKCRSFCGCYCGENCVRHSLQEWRASVASQGAHAPAELGPSAGVGSASERILWLSSVRRSGDGNGHQVISLRVFSPIGRSPKRIQACRNETGWNVGQGGRCSSNAECQHWAPDPY